jgi:hypothetical protein
VWAAILVPDAATLIMEFAERHFLAPAPPPATPPRRQEPR